MRGLVANLAFSAVVLLLGVAGLEAASRVLVPISPGSRFVDADGAPVEINAGPLSLAPGVAFRQVTADYDAWAHIGPLGYREPAAAGTPELVLLGDSFTFGQGLTDEQTFAARYCAAALLRCANLGRPGTGTAGQVAILDHVLREYGWRPREVKLFILAYSAGLASGNDFVDTVRELESMSARPAPASSEQPASQAPSSLWAALLAQRHWVLAHSNLARVLYQQFGPFLRSSLAGGSTAEGLEAGIQAMGTSLQRLQGLADQYSFRTTIYVVHPVQDLLRRTYPETLAAVRRAAGSGATVVSTAEALLDRPQAYYFPYDGHFNAAGAERVAAFLLAATPASAR